MARCDGIIRGARVHWDDADGLKAWVAAHEGRRVALTLVEETRSTAQNRYYQGVVVPMLAEVTGYQPGEMHDVLKLEFLPYGHVSTTDLTPAEFTAYVERICQWAAEHLDCVIPPPRA